MVKVLQNISFIALGIFILFGFFQLNLVFQKQSFSSDFSETEIKETSKSDKSSKIRVRPFDSNEVRLLESPFKAAMERNAKYLLSLDPDRFLHNTRKYAGLEPKGEIYGGWESRGVAGQTLGHYLTALSHQFAATGDERFKQRIDYIISEMDECQKAYGDGYIGALPPLELETLRNFKKGIVELDGGFNFKGGAWVPWYTEHKILAGLKDAWVLTGNEKAKKVTLKLANWIDDVTRPLTHEQLQQMLKVEQGGMSETLADIYALTSDPRYLETAHRFYHEAVMNPLLENRDELAGKHANTQIPKVIGEARLYEVADDENGREIADFFWEQVVKHHSYVIGGNSENEHFGQPDNLSKQTGPATAESCNTYNMLKLTRHLFEWKPKAEYFDFYERALYNHILASQDPQRGMFTYFMSLKPGHFKTFSTPEESFWCCVGTGMENHTKYHDSIYFHGEKDLYINLFIPSVLNWKKKGLTLEQHTSYPQGNRVDFIFNPSKNLPLNVKFRIPGWANNEVKFLINGKLISAKISAEGYAEIKRIWKKGDRLQMTIPLTVRTEAMPDDAGKVAFLYGPLVLAGDLGKVPNNEKQYAIEQWDNFNEPVAKVPVFVTEEKNLVSLVKRTKSDTIEFRVSRDVKPDAVTLRPFNEIFYDYYNVYWDVMTPAQYAERRAALKAEAERQARIDARTVDIYRPGEQQSEVDHRQTGENTISGQYRERKFRHATDGGWFAFTAKVKADKPLELLCTFWGGETGNRTFDILIDGKIIATQTLSRNKPDEFFEIAYRIPEELTRGKETVEVRFQAHPANMAGGLYGARILEVEDQ